MIPAIAVGALVLFCGVGGYLGWHKQWVRLLMVIAMLALALAGAAFLGRWSLDYGSFYLVMTAYLVCLPGMGGVAGGALLGWLARRHI